MRYMTLQLFSVLLAGAATERKDKMADRKALQLFSENSPANQANVYENATNLMPEDDDQVPAPSMPTAAGVVERFIGSMGGVCGAAVGGSVPGSLGFFGAAAGGSVSGFFARSESKKTQDVSTKKKGG